MFPIHQTTVLFSTLSTQNKQSSGLAYSQACVRGIYLGLDLDRDMIDIVDKTWDLPRRRMGLAGDREWGMG